MNNLQKHQQYLLSEYLKTKKLDDTMYREFKKVHCATFNGEPYYFIVIDTFEKTVAPILFGDAYFPVMRNSLYDTLPVGTVSDCGTLRVTEIGTPERIIQINTNVIHKQLKRFYRYHDSSSYSRKQLYYADITNHWESLVRIFTENGKRLDVRYNTTGNEKLALTMITNLMLALSLTSQQLYGYYKNDELFAVALVEYEPQRDMLHWVNTYRDDSVERSGNIVILDLIETCIEQGIRNLNMGLDFYDYKKLWSDKVTYTKGFEFVNPENYV